MRHVRDGREIDIEFLADQALPRFAVGDYILERGDFSFERFGTDLVARLHRLADLLRGGIAAGLGLLKLMRPFPARLVAADKSVGKWRKAAPRETSIETLRVVADQLDVMHEKSPVSAPRIGPESRRAK